MHTPKHEPSTGPAGGFPHETNLRLARVQAKVSETQMSIAACDELSAQGGEDKTKSGERLEFIGSITGGGGGSRKESAKDQNNAEKIAQQQQELCKSQADGADDGTGAVDDQQSVEELKFEFEKLELPRVEQMFKDLDKMAHLKTGDGRWLFDQCQKLETQMKRVQHKQQTDIGKVRTTQASEVSVSQRLSNLENEMGAVTMQNRWFMSKICNIYEQFGWEVPTGMTPVPSIRDDMSQAPLGEDGDIRPVVEGEVEQHPHQPVQVESTDGALSEMHHHHEQGGERIATIVPSQSFSSCKETFSGKEEEDVNRFLNRFEIWYKLSQLPEDQKGLRLTMQLKGRAEKVVNDLESEAWADFEKVKKHLVSKFAKGVTQQLSAKSKLEAMRYQDGDRFSDFIEKLSDLAKEAYPKKRGADLEERIFELAMNALPADFKVEMKRHLVEDLNQLLDKAPAVEAYLKEYKGHFKGQDRGSRGGVEPIRVHDRSNVIIPGARLPSEGMQHFSGRNINQFQQQERPRMGPPTMRGRPQQGYQEPMCYYCRERGHVAANCRRQLAGYPPIPGRGPQQQQYQPRVPIYQPQRQFVVPQPGNRRENAICYTCQGQGHFAYECPSFKGPTVESVRSSNSGRSYNAYGSGGGAPNTRPQHRLYPSQQRLPLPYRPQGPFQQNAANNQQPRNQPGNQQRDAVGTISQTVTERQVQPQQSVEDDKRPVTYSEFRDLKRINNYLVNKLFQKEDQETPDPDIVATASRHLDGITPEYVPVEKRLTTIPITINGVSMTGLFDTGASITLASRSLADLAKIELEENDKKVQSVTGHVMVSEKRGLARLTIGNYARRVEINFTEDDQLGIKNPYDIIIGVDVMRAFPPITLDSAKRVLTIGDEQQSRIDLRTKGELLREERKVFAIEERMIPAHAGAIITVLVDTSKGPNTEKMTIKQLQDKQVAYEESLVNIDKDSRTTIRVLNHSDAPVKIFKRMTVGTAENVIGEEDTLTNYPEISAAVLESARKIDEVDPSYIVDYSQCDAAPEQVDELRALIQKYQDQFSRNGYDLGLAKVSPMQIRTTTEAPFRPSIYHTHRGVRDDLQKQIEWMIQAGCIRESDTPWVSPIVMVKKKNGELRPCIDLRKLNEITIPDHFPLPRLSDTLDRVAGKVWLTGLDLNKGYHQVELDEEASRKCGIITPWGVYQCLTMPFGLRNAPSVFMRAMSTIMQGLEDICLVYMDDFIVMTGSEDFDQHLRDIERVLQRLKEYNIKANPKKCEFARKELTFLGHKVSREGIKPDDRNVVKITEFPVPKTRKEVKRFLGMCSFFRRFIAGYARIALPLSELTRLDVSWIWTEDHQQAFESLRAKLSSKPILTFPDDTKDYHLFVDASNDALGIALMQQQSAREKGKSANYQPITFYSRQFSKAERKWPIVQKELIAIVEGLRTTRYYTYGRKTVVHTDHRPLIHLIRKQAAHPNLARWLIELQQYGEDQLQIEYIEGERNTVADALSRLEGAIEGMNDQELEDLVLGPFCLDTDGDKERVAAIRQQISTRDVSAKAPQSIVFGGDKSIQELQKEDPELGIAIRALRGEIKLETIEGNAKWYAENCVLNQDGTLVYKRSARNGCNPIIIPGSLRRDVFSQFHTLKLGGGHACLEKTLEKMYQYAWKDKHKEVAVWHKECHDCQIRAPQRYKVPLVMTVLDQVFERMGVDCCGPLFKTGKGNEHYLVAIDMFSKWVIVVPIPDVKAFTVAKAIYEHVILTFGCPKEIVSDNAKTFTADFFEEVMQLLGIKKMRCTSYHSDGNAITERSIRDCSNMISKYLAEAEREGVVLEWDDLVKEIAFCHNVTKHSTIGMSPFYLMFGREPTFPVDLLLETRKAGRDKPDMKLFREHLIRTIEGARELATKNMQRTMEEVKRQADKRAKISDIAVGELVLYRDYRKRIGMSEKFKNPWLTIHRVKAIKNQHAWISPRDKPDDEPRRVHLNQIKRYYCEEERLSQKAMPQTENPVEKRGAKGVKGRRAQAQPSEKFLPQEPQVIERQTAKGMKLRTLIRDERGCTKAANT